MAGVEVIANQSISGTLSVADTTTLSTIANASGDTDKFLVSDSGAVKYRTGAQVRSDIGAGTGDGTVTGSGTATRVAFWSSSSALSSSGDLYWDNTNSRLGIGTDTPDEKLHIVDTSGANIILNSNAVAANSGIYMSEGADATPTQNGAYIYYDATNNLFSVATKTGSAATIDRFTIDRDTGAAQFINSVGITGGLTISTIAAVGSDTDKFLMSDSGEVAYVTGANLRSYIGAGTGDGTVTGSGAANKVAYWSSSSALTYDSNFTFNGTVLGLAGDNDVLQIGTGGAGTTSLFAFTGDTFYIQNDSAGGAVQIETDSFLVKNNGAGETYIEATDNGSVDLYYDNSKKIETTNTGIDISGGFTTSASSDCAGLNMTADIAMAGNDITLDTGAHIILDHTLGSGQASGTIVKYGSGILTAGKIYALYATMGTTTWQAVNQTDSHAVDMLAVSIGTSATSNGMLLSGILYKSSHGFTVGAPLYLASSDGDFTTTVPTTSNYYARVLGYAIDSSHIYFCPDNTWVKID
tara:strand:+ start:4362 stop:5933 length:1572 start_codon:yes stop_codon:yes gene_type:complete